MIDGTQRKIYAGILALYIIAAIAFECTANTARISTIGIYLVFAVGVFHFFSEQSIRYSNFNLFSVILLLDVFIMSFINQNSMSEVIVHFCLTCIVLCLIGYNLFVSMNKETITLMCLLAFIAGCIILAVRVIIAYGGISAMLTFSGEGVHERRVGGTLINENMLGMFMANAFFCGLVIFLKYKTKRPILSFGLLFFSFGFIVMLLLTASKKALLFLVVGTLLMIINGFHNYSGKKKLKILFFAIFGALLLYYVIGNIPSFRTVLLRINTLFQTLSGEGEVSQSDINRINYISWGLSAFMNSPVFGNGTGYSYILLHGSYSHNNFIELLMNYGVVGFGLYYIPYIFIIFRLIKMVRKNDLYALYFLVFVVMQLILGIGWVNYYERVIQLFTIFAVAYSEPSLIQKEKEYNRFKYIKLIG